MNNILKISLVLLLVFSCNSVDQPDLDVDDPLDLQANLLNGTWVLKDESSVTQTTLRTSFTVSGGLKEGNWVFDFIKQ